MDTTKLEAAADSAWSKVLARFITPLLIGIIGYLVVGKLNSMDEGVAGVKADVKELREGQGKQDVKIAEINGKVDGINSRIDGSLIYRMDELQKRVEQLERATKTP